MYTVIWQKATSLTCHPRGCKWIDPDLIHGFLDPHESAPNGILISSAIFARYRYIRTTNTQTDRSRYVWHLSQLVTYICAMQTDIRVQSCIWHCDANFLLVVHLHVFFLRVFHRYSISWFFHSVFTSVTFGWCCSHCRTFVYYVFMFVCEHDISKRYW